MQRVRAVAPESGISYQLSQSPAPLSGVTAVDMMDSEEQNSYQRAGTFSRNYV